MINRERLAETFRTLAQTSSPSKREGELAADLRRRLDGLGSDTWVDGSAAATGSDTGNLIARLGGSAAAPPLVLCAHMDTVGPADNIRVRFEDGVFTSDGTTILGADDKSSIAVVLEALQVLRERGIAHGPLELVFTTCEEIGLAGAKHLDFSRICGRFGYALDAADTEGIITRSPSANRFEIRVLGRDAHAGSSPEKGINAIHLAAKAMAGLAIGRIDHETTCNIGVIAGGTATNIVPPLVDLRGEARSHDEEKLEGVTRGILEAFEQTAAAHRRPEESDGLPRVACAVRRSYHRTRIPDDHPLVSLAVRAAASLGRPMRAKISGGGSDANIFFEKGVPLGVLGTGMREVHTTREYVKLAEMARAAELLVEIIRLHAAAA
ncbi:MAG: M20/M25/M40 family metallo-hydrolase [Desulfobacterales bacterium]|jgi:tripeptide aminopeptidase|nr:M20/M25/M40 family metallo-hydrolase [Desulfobacterales bacterium]